MITRKSFLLTFAAATVSAISSPSNAIVRSGVPRTRPYTTDTAPDTASKAILRHPVRRITNGKEGGAFSSKMHANFPQIIEQNFARVNSRHAETIIESLSEVELNALAQRYVNAVADSGFQARLYDVLAHRLQAPHLSRISRSFGYMPIYESIMRIAPHKLLAFEQGSQVNYPARNLGVSTSLTMNTEGSSLPTPTAGNGQFLFYTVEEIYLSFRTAPIGALGVVGSMYETALVLGATLPVAYGIGYGVGNMIAPLIQTHRPGLWDAIGGTIYQMIENIFGPDSQNPGRAERDMAISFEIPSSTRDIIAGTGGDYGVAEAWQQYSGGGGFVDICDFCSWY